MHHPTDRITYHSLCYTSHGALDGTRNSSMSSTFIYMKDRSDDPSHNERTPLPRSYISLPNNNDDGDDDGDDDDDDDDERETQWQQTPFPT